MNGQLDYKINDLPFNYGNDQKVTKRGRVILPFL